MTVRTLLALIALALAGLAVYQGHASRGTIQIIERTLEDNEIVAVEDEYENAPGRPTYIPRTDICVWSELDGSDIRCQRAPRAEYPSEELCIYTEWQVISALAADAERRGQKLGGRVVCVQEYDA